MDCLLTLVPVRVRCVRAQPRKNLGIGLIDWLMGTGGHPDERPVKGAGSSGAGTGQLPSARKNL